MKSIFILMTLLIITFLPVQIFAQIDTTEKNFIHSILEILWQYRTQDN